MIKKISFGAAIALGVAAGVAAPASADPNPFGSLGCSCQAPAPDGKTPTAAQVDQGIQNGLGYLHGTPPRPSNN